MQFVHYSIQSLLLDETGSSDLISREKHFSVTAIETDGVNLYIGTSNGYVYHFVLEKGKKSFLKSEYIIASKHILLEGKSVKSILLLPQIACVLILCGNALFFSNFPELSPMFGLHPIRGVIDICQDLDKLGETEADGSVILTVLTTRKIKRIKIKDTIVLVSDIDFSFPIIACQRGFVCCVANNQHYELINFENNRKTYLFPLQGNGTFQNNASRALSLNLMPIIVSVSKSEFVVTTSSSDGENAIGLFIDINGDIVRGTVMFSGYPAALASEFPFLMALIDNSFIEIHNIINQTLVQIVQSPFLGSITKIFRVFGDFSVFFESLMEKIIIVEAMSSKSLINQAVEIENNELLEEEIEVATRLSNIPSKIFLIGETGINCLTFNSFLVHMDEFLNSEEIDNVLFSIRNFAEIMIPENIHSERIYHEFSYIYQKAGFIYLENMLFDDAISQFEKSDIDPRLIISLFPVFNTKLDGIMVYKGIDELICRLVDIDNIISSNVSKKFPDILTSDDKTLDSKNYGLALYKNALNMLKKYLLKYRQRKGLGSIGASEKNKQIFKAVDLVLLKLLVYLSPEEDSTVLYQFINSGIECFDDAVVILEKNGKHFLLSKLYQNMKMQNKVLEIWKNILDGILYDDEFLDGEEKIKDYLFEVDDSNLCIDYSIWLIEKNPDIQIEFFINLCSRKTFKFSMDEVINILRSRSKLCLKIYLEYIISNTCVYNLSFLNELLLLYINETIDYLEVPAIKDFVERSIIDYSELKNDKMTYFEYLSTYMMESDDGYKKFILCRMKLIELLQTAPSYDLDFVLKSLYSQKDLLLIELVVLYGRFSMHEEALSILVHTLKDYKTSEIYCYHRGLSVKLYHDNQETEETLLQRKKLFKMLLDQYLKLIDYNERFSRISFLLKRWDIYFDVIYVLKVISNDWSVERISGFLINIFQKTIQEKYQSQLIKSLHRSCTFYDYSRLVTFIDKPS